MQASSDLNFALANGANLVLTKECINQINDFVQDNRESEEAGGIILGRFIKDAKDIIIDKVTTPMSTDLRTRFSFKRKSVGHQDIADKEWEESKGTCNYLGEWHSHPESIPKPSEKDLFNWRRKLLEESHYSEILLFLILGTKEISIWEGNRKTLNLKKLTKLIK